MESGIYVFRVAATKRLSKAAAKAFAADMAFKVAAKLVRKARPELSEFLVSDFHDLPIVPRATLKAPGNAVAHYGAGWRIPDADLHGLPVANSTRNSLDIWVKANVPVERDAVAFLVISPEKAEAYNLGKAAKAF